MNAARVQLGHALIARADDVAGAVLATVWPTGHAHVERAAVEAIAETDRVSARQIGRWLVDGQTISEEDRRALGSLGGMVDRLALDDLVKAYLAWRDVMLRLLREAAAQLDTPPEIAAQVAKLIARNADGSVVRMARRFEHGRELLHQQLADQAMRDALTGMPNRILLFDRMEHALRVTERTDQRLAVLFVDLDGFKAVNDRLGHQAGDEMLIIVAERIGEAVREADTVARIGGDEFVILCENVRESEQPVEIAERIIASLNRPFVVAAGAASISASVGIAESGGCDGPEKLLMRADQAMYAAKRHGPGGHRVSAPALA
jgi:diguanylate cyclase (GGDEF)-like protein